MNFHIWINIMNIATILSILSFFLPLNAHALTQEELKPLQEAVKEMCLFPDRMGDYLKVEGDAKVGLPVAIKTVKGDLSGKLAYEKWKGIPITLDKYKTDPRQCAQEILKILAPALAPTKQTNPVQIAPVVIQQVSGGGSINIYNNIGDSSKVTLLNSGNYVPEQQTKTAELNRKKKTSKAKMAATASAADAKASETKLPADQKAGGIEGKNNRHAFTPLSSELEAFTTPTNCGTLPAAWLIIPKSPYTSVDFYYAELDVSAIDRIVDIYAVGDSTTYDAATHKIRWGGTGSSIYGTHGANGGWLALKFRPKVGVNAGGADLAPVVRVQAQPGGVLEDHTTSPVHYAFSNCAGNIAPTSAFRMSVGGVPQNREITISAGATVTFDPSASNDPDGTIMKYEWDFDGNGVYDKMSKARASTTYTYSNAGIYYPQLRVTDNKGASSLNDIIHQVIVQAASNTPAPVCSLSASVPASQVISVGTQVILTYSVTGSVTDAVIHDNAGATMNLSAAAGTLSVTPQTTASYTLSASGSGGNCIPAFAYVTVGNIR